jgi:D-glycero-D-manno-heptose 1,7-bisphosphate phosphatase
VRAGRAANRLTAVFLDRDGVINRNAAEGDYVKSWAEFRFLPGALEALRLLAALEAPVVVVTNQRGIARGRMTESDLADINWRMHGEVARAGGRIDRVEFCPHESDCDCRKPATGMFVRAARDMELDLSGAAMIGDRATDMQAAEAIGALKVLIRGHPEPMPEVDYEAEDLLDAVRWLTSRSSSS